MNDCDIRVALKQDLARWYASEADTIIIDEFSIKNGAARIDLAVVNGALHGFELKGDRDSLSRLSEQAEAFSAVFDYLTLVVCERHLRRAVEIIPDSWGVRVVRVEDGTLFFRDLKLPTSNHLMSAIAVAKLLWRQEAIDFLKEMDSEVDVSSRPKRDIYAQILQRADIAGLRQRVRRCLKERQSAVPPRPYGD